MMNLVSRVMNESDEMFEKRLEMAETDESRQELMEIREGMMKRKSFMEANIPRFIYFATAEEKLLVIKSWYPRTYRMLADRLPGFVLNPDDMPAVVMKIADEFIAYAVLPSDRDILTFSERI